LDNGVDARALSFRSANSLMSTALFTQRLTFWEKMGYGSGDAACCIVFQMVNSFIPYFYTDVFGLSAAAMGTLTLWVRLLMSPADLAMGVVADRTKTRWGKFRPYLLWICVPYAVIAVLTFTTPDFSADAKLIYAYLTFSLLLIVYAAINVPYCALGAVLTPDPQERVSLNGYRFFLAMAGATMVVSSTMPLVNYFGGENQQIGFQRTMMLLAAIAVLLFVSCFFLTKERVKPAVDSTFGFWSDLRFLARNDQWFVVAGMNFILFIAIIIQDGGAIYYVTWYLGRKDFVGPFLTTGMISSMLGSLFAEALSSRMSKRAAYANLQIIIVVVSVVLFLLDSQQVWLIFVVYAVQQFFTQMASPILWSMMADTTDYGEYITGRRTTGLAFSGMLFFLKIGAAIGGAILGWSLAAYGYVGKADSQSTEVIHGIVLMFAIAPAVGHLLLAVLVQLYKLDDQACRKIHTELKNRRAASSTK
jgi:glycoside/pentoside/hexuronide:cation symporter, GPH family